MTWDTAHRDRKVGAAGKAAEEKDVASLAVAGAHRK